MQTVIPEAVAQITKFGHEKNWSNNQVMKAQSILFDELKEISIVIVCVICAFLRQIILNTLAMYFAYMSIYVINIIFKWKNIHIYPCLHLWLMSNNKLFLLVMILLTDILSITHHIYSLYLEIHEFLTLWLKYNFRKWIYSTFLSKTFELQFTSGFLQIIINSWHIKFTFNNNAKWNVKKHAL